MIRVEQPSRTKEAKRAKKIAEQLAEQERIELERIEKAYREKSRFRRILKI